METLHEDSFIWGEAMNQVPRLFPLPDPTMLGLA